MHARAESESTGPALRKSPHPNMLQSVDVPMMSAVAPMVSALVASSPESSAEDATEEAKFAEMRNRKPARRLLVFDNGSQRSWEDDCSDSSGTSGDDCEPHMGRLAADEHTLRNPRLSPPESALRAMARVEALPHCTSACAESAEYSSALLESARATALAELDGQCVESAHSWEEELNAIIQAASRDSAALSAAKRNQEKEHSILRRKNRDQLSQKHGLNDVAQLNHLDRHAGSAGLPLGSMVPKAVISPSNPETQTSFQDDLDSASESLRRTSLEVKCLSRDLKNIERSEDEIRQVIANAELHLGLLEKELFAEQASKEIANKQPTKSRGSQTSQDKSIPAVWPREPCRSATQRDMKQVSAHCMNRAWRMQGPPGGVRNEVSIQSPPLDRTELLQKAKWVVAPRFAALPPYKVPAGLSESSLRRKKSARSTTKASQNDISQSFRDAVTNASSVQELLALAHTSNHREGDRADETQLTDVQMIRCAVRSQETQSEESPLELDLPDQQIKFERTEMKRQCIEKKETKEPRRERQLRELQHQARSGPRATPAIVAGISSKEDKEKDVEKWVGLANACAGQRNTSPDASVLIARARAMAASEIEGAHGDTLSCTPSSPVRDSKTRKQRKTPSNAVNTAKCEPAMSQEELAQDNLRQRLVRYFRRYNPARLADVESLVVQFVRREHVLEVLLRHKYGGNLVRRDRPGKSEPEPMTKEEKDAKQDLLRDREALQYAEFWHGSSASLLASTPDHARVSPYHSSKLQRLAAEEQIFSTNASRIFPSQGSGMRKGMPVSSRTDLSPSDSARRRDDKCDWTSIEDVGSMSTDALLGSTALPWPILKLQGRELDLQNIQAWSPEKTAVFLSNANQPELSTQIVEGMRLKGLDGLGLLGMTDALLQRRYSLHSKGPRAAVLHVTARLRTYLGIDFL